MPAQIDLDGRRALVTGASRGIGAAIARTYAEAGAQVAITARDGQALRSVAAEISERTGRDAFVILADVTDPEDIGRAVSVAGDQLGGLDILVNNAGGNRVMAPVASIPLPTWRESFTLNLDPVMLFCQAAFPLLSASDGAAVVNVASAAALGGAPFLAHYAAAKAAVISLTRSLAMEWAHAGVRVNALVPGWVETDLTASLRRERATEEAILAQVPMGRWAQPDEIAGPAVFLACDLAGFITGQELIVDGGLSI